MSAFWLSESHGLILWVNIARYGRNFVIIGSATGIYTAQRGKSGESRLMFSTCSLYNFSDLVRPHRNPEPHEPDIDLHPPRLQQGHHPSQQ